MSTTTPQLVPVEFATELIKILIVSIPQSIAGWFWMIVKIVWTTYWLYIIIFLTIWTIWELITRNGGMHYNSENGFSPTYNSFVGSGVYALFQVLTYTILTKIFDNEIYVNIWPYPIHIFVFLGTGLFLNLVGFWKYWKLPRI